MRKPVVIGGVGGSGTRVIRAILELSGVHMGGLVNAAGDSLELWHFNSLFLNPLLSQVRRVDYKLADVPAPLRRSTLAGLSVAIRIFTARFDPAAGPWGFKCPRTIYILPFLKHLLPDLAFIHVVRDGRDMTLSSNRWQLKLHYEALFGAPLGEDHGLAQARLWNRVNDDAARWAAAHLPESYHVLRFEDLCARPRKTIRSLLEFLDAPPPRPSRSRSWRGR